MDSAMTRMEFVIDGCVHGLQLEDTFVHTLHRMAWELRVSVCDLISEFNRERLAGRVNNTYPSLTSVVRVKVLEWVLDTSASQGTRPEEVTLSRNLPTVKQLQYLAILKKTGHFGKAAEALGVSQSTLSAGIAELEETVGQLVERTKRSVIFNKRGDHVVNVAHKVLANVDALLLRPLRDVSEAEYSDQAVNPYSMLGY